MTIEREDLYGRIVKFAEVDCGDVFEDTDREIYIKTADMKYDQSDGIGVNLEDGSIKHFTFSEYVLTKNVTLIVKE